MNITTVIPNGDGTSTRTFYGPDGEVTGTEALTGLPIPDPPVHDHDVARLIDLTGEIQKLAAQETAPTVDGVLPITTAELTIPTNDQEFTIPNPGIGRSATFTITFSNTSGSTKFVDFVPVPNNYGGGSGASGFADGTNRRFVMVVTGGASAPSVDMVEI